MSPVWNASFLLSTSTSHPSVPSEPHAFSFVSWPLVTTSTSSLAEPHTQPSPKKELWFSILCSTAWPRSQINAQILHTGRVSTLRWSGATKLFSTTYLSLHYGELRIYSCMYKWLLARARINRLQGRFPGQESPIRTTSRRPRS